jgi:hypothetical protein
MSNLRKEIEEIIIDWLKDCGVAGDMIDEEPSQLATALEELFRNRHCEDCCCAQSWEALGIKEYTGMSIPEHISELKRELFELKGGYDKQVVEGGER